MSSTPTSYQVRDIDIECQDAFVLKARYFGSEQPTVVAQLHTGTGIPQKLYQNFACYLASKGVGVVTFDYRGVAESSPRPYDDFDADLMDWATLDMDAVYGWVGQMYPNARHIVIGHSIGAQLLGFMPRFERIDTIIMIASCTGYYKDMAGRFRYTLHFAYRILFLLFSKVVGRMPLSWIRQGEDIPAGVALQFRRWCLTPDYFRTFRSEFRLWAFDRISCPLHAFQIVDDPLANQVSSNKLLEYFPNAIQTIHKIDPKDYGVKSIGHTGFFSRQFQASLWSEVFKLCSEQ